MLKLASNQYLDSLPLTKQFLHSVHLNNKDILTTKVIKVALHVFVPALVIADVIYKSYKIIRYPANTIQEPKSHWQSRGITLAKYAGVVLVAVAIYQCVSSYKTANASSAGPATKPALLPASPLPALSLPALSLPALSLPEVRDDAGNILSPFKNWEIAKLVSWVITRDIPNIDSSMSASDHTETLPGRAFYYGFFKYGRELSKTNISDIDVFWRNQRLSGRPDIVIQHKMYKYQDGFALSQYTQLLNTYQIPIPTFFLSCYKHTDSLSCEAFVKLINSTAEWKYEATETKGKIAEKLCNKFRCTTKDTGDIVSSWLSRMIYNHQPLS